MQLILLKLTSQMYSVETDFWRGKYQAKYLFQISSYSVLFNPQNFPCLTSRTKGLSTENLSMNQTVKSMASGNNKWCLADLSLFPRIQRSFRSHPQMYYAKEKAASPQWIFPSGHLHGPVKIDCATRGCDGHGNQPLTPLAPRKWLASLMATPRIHCFLEVAHPQLHLGNG